MKDFLGNDFLLKNETAKVIYNQFVKDLPIYDFHCHLSAQEIAEDKVFLDIGELLLKCDHYKWRLMRICGVPEDLITGNASFKDKFLAFANILPSVVGNPVYHWTHMELKKYFGITEPVNAQNALRVYNQANEMMADGTYSAQKLITKSNVKLIATTDDPSDDLIWHKKISEIANFSTKVVPTFRPDLACNLLKEGFSTYIEKLGNSANTKISSLDSLLAVLNGKLDFFEKHGSKIADHGIENIPNYSCEFDEAAVIFKKALTEKVTQIDAEKFLYFMLSFFAKEYKRRQWAMQIHMSVIRNQNSKLLKNLGPDCGIDSSGDVLVAKSLGKLFDEIENSTGMPKTILYSLNPTSNYVLSTMLGNFAGEVAGKMQLGAAWWFCDHRDGIIEQLKLLSSTGSLGCFVGMLTDSRSFISYARHDYFRRILCSLIGEWVEDGEMYSDMESLKNLVSGISYYNAVEYFGM